MIDPALSPWPRLGRAFVLVALACAASYVWLDRPIAEWFRAHLMEEPLAVFRRITDLGLGGVYLIPAALAFALFRWRAAVTLDEARARWRVRANAAALLFSTVAASGLLVDALKYCFGRYRPKELFDHGLYGFDPFGAHWAHNSFPSGHGQTAYAAMTALAWIWPKGRPLFVFLAVLIAASRVIVSAHYLSDVLMGAYIGAAGTLLVARLFHARGWEVRQAPPTPSSAP